MPGIIPTSTIDRVREANDIVEIVGAVLPLKKAGANYIALCPFHNEKTPSFSVNGQKQIFHCFGCQQGGDVFKFIQQYEGLSFTEAVQRLAERANIAIDFGANKEDRGDRRRRDTLFSLHDQLSRRWEGFLRDHPEAKIARAYLEKRGVSAQSVETFRLGYSLDSWDDALGWAKTKSYDDALMEQGGLAIRREGSNRLYDRFRGRLMFPIADEQGRIAGFSGRVLKGDDKTAKYINSPETPIFKKGRIMYALDKAKRPLLNASYGVVCEGQLDTIACHAAGVENAIAPQGTALTQAHARVLKRYVDEVVLCFDADEAGQKAAVRSLDDLLSSGLSIRVAAVPSPHDPDSYIRERGSEAFQQLLASAPSFFDFYLTRLCNAHSPRSDSGRATIVRSMGDALKKTNNEVLTDTYAQKTAQRLEVSIDAVRQEFSKSSIQVSLPEPSPEYIEPDIQITPPQGAELWLIKLVLANDDLIEWVEQHFDPHWLDNTLARTILLKRLEQFIDDSWTGIAGFISYFDSPEIQSFLTGLTSERRNIENPSTLLPDTVLRIRNRKIESRLRQLTAQMADASHDDQARFFEEQIHLRQVKATPLGPLPDSGELF